MEYFIADLHNMDKNILTYERRPFKDLIEMRNVIINNWNETIDKDDTVYLLGDIGDIEILKHLKGKIVIVIGNHDNITEIKLQYPDIETSAYSIMIDNLWLSHKPIGYIPPEIPYLNIHGDLHRFIYGLPNRKWEDGNRYFCVSVEQIGYKPISKKDIYEYLEFN